MLSTSINKRIKKPQKNTETSKNYEVKKKENILKIGQSILKLLKIYSSLTLFVFMRLVFLKYFANIPFYELTEK